MTNRKGFTLIELMVVIFIVGILAAVAIPIMRGRIDAAKWSEGKSAAGSIRTAARAYCAERGPTFDYSGGVTLAELGFADAVGGNPADLDGKYFVAGDYDVQLTGYNTYTVTVTAGGSAEAPGVPGSITLDQDGTFTEIP
jgi:type IV pilus assembly protein PilA